MLNPQFMANVAIVESKWRAPKSNHALLLLNPTATEGGTSSPLLIITLRQIFRNGLCTRYQVAPSAANTL